jgi:hypothetical protein
MAQLLRPAVVLVLVAVAAAPLAGAGAGAPTGDDLGACRPHVTVRRDGWARIESPDYADSQGGEAVIAASAAPAGRERRLYVTNGRVVKMSSSAGCKWDPIFPKPNNISPPDVNAAVVTALVAPSDDALWLTSYDSSGGVPRPHVAMTNDATFTGGSQTKEPIGYVDDGLPSVGTPVQLVVPRRPDKAFLLVEQPYDPHGDVRSGTRSLYLLTLDDRLAPATGSKRPVWQQVTLPSTLASVDGLAMSPRQTDTVWAWHGKTYAWTDDGGATWRSGQARGPITAIDVDESGVPGIFSRAAQGGVLRLVDPVTGNVRAESATPVAATAVAHGYQSGTYAISGGDRTYGYDTRTSRWVDITPAGGPELTGLAFGTTAKGRILVGRTSSALYRFDLYRDESFLPVPQGPPIVEPPPTGPAGPPGFAPPRRVVTVAPGHLADTSLDFTVPPSPGRIDVFFLVDTTSSMTNAIKGLREGVRKIAADVTARSRGPACFGVGEVKDFSVADNPWYGAAAVTPYKLQKKITCSLDDLAKGLDALKEGGGDRYPEEAQTVGLVQAVKGDGQVSPPVVAGQDAGFVAPTRVIVLITDAGFKMEPGFPGFPSMDATVEALTKYAQHTYVVGVLLQTTNNLGPAVADMTELTRRTQTFAPAAGVDCDNDGLRDVDPGAPLVCKAADYAPSIAPAIIALLLGVKEPAQLGVAADDPSHVVAGVRLGSGAVARGKAVRVVANVRIANTVTFRPVLTCSPAQDGQDLPVRVLGSRRDLIVAEAGILVRCRGSKVVPPPPPAPPVRVPPDPVPVPHSPLVPLLAVPFQPPVVNNPPANLNPNAGLSSQEEEQLQVATVSQGVAEDDGAEDVELAMSGLPRDSGAARMVLGCAAMTSLGGAVTFAHRRRTQRAIRPAYARR